MTNNKLTRKRLTEMQGGEIFRAKVNGASVIGVYDDFSPINGDFANGTEIKYHTRNSKTQRSIFSSHAPETIVFGVIGNEAHGRKKVDITTLILSIVAALIVSLIVCSAFCYVPKIDRVDWEEVTHKVKYGETLWEISKLYCPADVDCRDWIEKVQEINGIGSMIYVGDRLTVLVEKGQFKE